MTSVEFRRASEEDRERFSYGQCMWFALATHQRMGWPMEAVLDEAGWIAHAWTRMPAGARSTWPGRMGPKTSKEAWMPTTPHGREGRILAPCKA